MGILLRRLHGWWHRRHKEAELREELEFHLSEEVADAKADGLSDVEAWRVARLRFGSRDIIAEDTRATWEWPLVRDGVRDVRHCVRALRRNPGFTLTAVVMFAIGIGANTMIFSVVDAVLLRPLSYANPQQLVVVHETSPQLGRVPVGGTEFEELRRSAHSFDRMALLASEPALLTGAGDPVRLDIARASASLFSMLGTSAALGRTFISEEETVGRHRVVILSHGLWRTRFGADAAIVGRSILLNDQSYTVIGVLPSLFRFPRLEQVFVMGIPGGQPQLWLPMAIGPIERSENSYAAIAQLKEGVSSRQAQEEVAGILTSLTKQMPNAPHIGTDVVPLQTQMTSDARAPLILLWAAVTVVLLIACGNIASLLFARSLARRPELAIRAALGASPRALTRHLLLEGVVLAVAGGTAGVLIATWALPVVVGVVPSLVPRLDEVALNARALLFAAFATTVTAVVVTIVPARRIRTTAMPDSLRAGARGATITRREWRIRNLVVGGQIALTVVCLGVAALVATSLTKVLHVPLGFQSDGVLTVDVTLSPERYDTREARAAFVRQALDRLAATPGIASVGFVTKLALTGTAMNSLVAIEGTETDAVPFTERPLADVRSADPGYFATMGVTLLNGQVFTPSDTRPVAMLSASMAKRLWPSESAVGKRFRLSAQGFPLTEVIGVVGDVRQMGAETAPSQTIYLPYWQRRVNGTSFTLRTTLPMETAAKTIRMAIASIDNAVPIEAIRTMDSIVSQSVEIRTFQTTLLVVFGGVAAMLAAIGIFGVMSYAVAQRSRELSVRLALGASRASLQRLMLGRAFRLAVGGVAVGVPMTIAVGHVLRGLLFGVVPQSPAILTGTSTAMILIAIVAAWLPSKRAAQRDVMETLRAE